ncbi:hypothetical protein WG66_014927, partial [Moniliophthora roreri]
PDATGGYERSGNDGQRWYCKGLESSPVAWMLFMSSWFHSRVEDTVEGCVGCGIGYRWLYFGLGSRSHHLLSTKIFTLHDWIFAVGWILQDQVTPEELGKHFGNEFGVGCVRMELQCMHLNAPSSTPPMLKSYPRYQRADCMDSCHLDVIFVSMNGYRPWGY